jgi:hypothetical protein
MPTFVILREGNEPFAVNPDAVAALQGMSGGRETMVVLLTGGAERVQHSVSTILSLFGATQPGAGKDWLEPTSRDLPKGHRRG